jgi:hypothetical protein
VPDWLMPGEARELTMTVVNNGGSTWHADERYELGNTGNVDWGFPAMPVTDTLAPNTNPFVHKSDVRVFTFVITALPTAGYYELDVDIRQRGGGGSGRVLHKIIAVQPVEPRPPAMPPPPPVKLVTVPDVLYLSAADAGKLIINAGLRQSAPFDPSPADPRKTVVYQSPFAGTQVLESFTVIIGYVLDQTTPPGYAGVTFTNCRPGALELYLLTLDGWQSRGTISSQRGDDGMCPKPGSAPLSDKLYDGKANYYVVVDPSLCSDPKDPYCRTFEWAAWGEAAGEVFPHDF